MKSFIRETLEGGGAVMLKIQIASGSGIGSFRLVLGKGSGEVR